MTRKQQSLVTGTNGTTISAANSGGQGQDAFDVVTIGANATCTYDDSQNHSGAFAAKIVTSGTTVNTALMQYNAGLSMAEFWLRMYVYFTAAPASILMLQRSFAAGALEFGIAITTTGTIRMIKSAAATVATTTTTLVTSQWNRIDCHYLASTGACDLSLYQGDAQCAAPYGTATGGATISGTATAGANIDDQRFGSITALSPAPGTFWIDDIAFSDVGSREVGPFFKPPLNKPVMAAMAASIW